MPSLEAILAGRGESIPFPGEPSSRYATTVGLTVRTSSADQALSAFRWMVARAPAEWVQLFASDTFRLLRAKGRLGVLAQLVQQDPQLQRFLGDFQRLLHG